MADANSVPSVLSSEPVQSNDQHQNEQIVPNENPLPPLPIVEYFTPDELLEISNELFRDWSDDERHAEELSSVPNDQQQNKPAVSNVSDTSNVNTVNTLPSIDYFTQDELLEISDDLFRDWSDKEDFTTVVPHNDEELNHFIPHLNELFYMDALPPQSELTRYWFVCCDNELLMKCFILHFIGLFKTKGATLCTLRG